MDENNIVKSAGAKIEYTQRKIFNMSNSSGTGSSTSAAMNQRQWYQIVFDKYVTFKANADL